MIDRLRALLFLWFPLGGSILAWAVHLIVIAGMARYTCNVPSARWALHASTVACLAVAGAATAVAAARAHGDHLAMEQPGPVVFLAKLSVIVGATNLVLITLEELVVVALGARACG